MTGTNAGRQVGSLVCARGSSSQLFILTYRVGYWKQVEKGRWGGIFIFKPLPF